MKLEKKPTQLNLIDQQYQDLSIAIRHNNESDLNQENVETNSSSSSLTSEDQFELLNCNEEARENHTNLLNSSMKRPLTFSWVSNVRNTPSILPFSIHTPTLESTNKQLMNTALPELPERINEDPVPFNLNGFYPWNIIKNINNAKMNQNKSTSNPFPTQPSQKQSQQQSIPAITGTNCLNNSLILQALISAAIAQQQQQLKQKQEQQQRQILQATLIKILLSTQTDSLAALIKSLIGVLGGNNQTNKTQPESTISRYKTELCRSYEETGECKYGKKCQFAHGNQELRNFQRHPKYKTELCRSFHNTGFCPYGIRCHFVHSFEEVRSTTTATTTTSATTGTFTTTPTSANILSENSSLPTINSFTNNISPKQSGFQSTFQTGQIKTSSTQLPTTVDCNFCQTSTNNQSADISNELFRKLSSSLILLKSPEQLSSSKISLDSSSMDPSNSLNLT